MESTSHPSPDVDERRKFIRVVTPELIVKQMESLPFSDRYKLLHALITGLRMCGTLDAWLVDDMQQGMDALSWVMAKVNWAHEAGIDANWLAYTTDVLEKMTRDRSV
jgi:hypothetical protein